MYPNPIPISNGTATISYDYRGSNIDSSSYKDASAALDQDHSLVVKHQHVGAGVSRQRRTLIRIDRIVEDAQGVQGLLSVYLNVVIPEGIATSTQVTEQVTLMKNFLSASGYIAKVVSGDI